MSVEEIGARIERLTAEVEKLPDPRARRLAEDLSLAVIEMHGEGLAALIAGLDPAVVRRAADDDLIGSLLMLHGLHPVPIEDRVVAGLREMDADQVELVEVVDGVARLHETGRPGACGTAATIERELQAAVPDLIAVEIVDPDAGIQLPIIQHVPHSLTQWVRLDGVADLAPGELRAAAVEGASLVVANCDGDVMAYRDSCKSCGSSLAGGVLIEGVLDCPGCGRRWYLPRAGRSMDDDRLQLDPVPLLRGADIRVAL